MASVEVCVPGDSNGDELFNEKDLIQVFQSAKYDTGEPADRTEGDWNSDRKFDSGDLVYVFQAGTYLQDKLIDDLSSLVTETPAYQGAFGPPITIANEQQLGLHIGNRKSAQAIADATDFNRQSLLLFSWSGSGGDRLVAEPSVVGGGVNIAFKFSYGLTDDLRPHIGLVAIPKEANWGIDIEERNIHEDSVRYEFDNDAKLVVTGGFAGVRDEYAIDGSFTLSRNDDGSATFSQVDATLRGEGLSSLDGESLDSILNLSGLTGLQVYRTSVVFSGVSGSVAIRLSVDVRDGSLAVSGSDLPPCCDFFGHAINATATRIPE